MRFSCGVMVRISSNLGFKICIFFRKLFVFNMFVFIGFFVSSFDFLFLY